MVEVPLVDPNENQVRIRNIYAGVNATDINITAARYFSDGNIPFDIGLEALGIVDKVGANVDSFKQGDAVLAFPPKPSTFSEYLYVSPQELIPIPEMKPEFLVSLVNGLTATIALDFAGRVKSGDKVLVTAAAGGTGQIVCQWAKHRGAYVIAMTSSDEKAEFLKSLNVDLIINYRKENVDDVLSKNFPDGIDVIWETIGGKVFEMLFNHLAIRGRMVIIGSIATYKEHGFSDETIPSLNKRLLLKSQSLNGFFLLNYKDVFPKYMSELLSMIHNGKIKAKIALDDGTEDGKFFGLDKIYLAEEYLHSGKNIGKVVVQIQNP